LDEDELVPYRIGESFYLLKAEEVAERMEGEKVAVEGEMTRMEEDVERCKTRLATLKRVLYGKFGSSINLER
jgi:prefoldin subunit 4